MTLTLEEAGDRLAIRELFDAYADCADRRDTEGQMALFTADCEFLVYMDSNNPVPTQEVRGRDGLRPVFEDLKQYAATTHFNGQSTVSLSGTSASGVSYCLAHHVSVHAPVRRLMIASIRYLDEFAKTDGRWLFKRRKLMVDWIDNRVLQAD
jgi:ketosteroid isomerase-like protein